MPSLAIPESGLSLGSAHRPSAAPEAIALTLTDNVIEEMIKCFQNGQSIELALGEQPSLLYGNKSHSLSSSTESFHHELFRTTYSDSENHTSSDEEDEEEDEDDDMDYPLRANPKKGIQKVQQKVHTGFLAMFGKNALAQSILKKTATTTVTKASSSSVSTKPISATAGVDDALASLKNSLASEKAKKDEKTINYVKDGSLGTPGRRGGPASKITNKSRLLAQNRGSMPTSPALSGVGSPSLGPTSVPPSQQKLEKEKALRKPVIHLLAANPMKESALIAMIEDEPSQDIKNALYKVGDLNDTTGKYELRKTYYKELDVWNYEFDTQETRQRAIDNAVKIYDRLRLAISDPEWDRLLPKKERGTGKVLSVLQKDIAEGLGRGPKLNVARAEDSGRDTPVGDEVLMDKQVSKVKGESTPRAGSQTPNGVKPKLNAKDAQAKRLLSNKPPKPQVVKAPAAPRKRKEEPAKPTGKVLSAAYVNSSDDDDDFLTQPVPVPMQVPVTKLKPAPKPITKQPPKRSRDADDEASDSSVPLSKKVKNEIKKDVKAKEPLPRREMGKEKDKGKDKEKERDVRSMNSQSSQRSKGNSPPKSSPLASSPPTNASDIENSSTNTSGRVSPARVRKVSRSPIHKRHQKSSSVTSSVSSTSSSSQRSLTPAVVDLARKYRVFYPKYKALHDEVSNLKGRRDYEMETRLLDMHERLAGMKAEIIEGIIEL